MAKAFVRDGCSTFITFEMYIDATQEELKESLKNIQSAFAGATENWKDKNADFTKELLDKHARAMEKAMCILNRMSWASEELYKIVDKYDNE